MVRLGKLGQGPTLHVVQENEKTRLILINFHTINQVLAVDGGKEGAFTTDPLSVDFARVFSTDFQDENFVIFLAHDLVYEAFVVSFFVFVDQFEGNISVLRVFSLKFSATREESVDL